MIAKVLLTAVSHTNEDKPIYVSSGSAFYQMSLLPFTLDASVSGSDTSSFVEPKRYFLDQPDLTITLDNTDGRFSLNEGVFTSSFKGCQLVIKPLNDVFYVQEHSEDLLQKTVTLRANTIWNSLFKQSIDLFLISGASSDMKMSVVLKYLDEEFDTSFSNVDDDLKNIKVYYTEDTKRISVGDLLFQFLFLLQRKLTIDANLNVGSFAILPSSATPSQSLLGEHDLIGGLQTTLETESASSFKFTTHEERVVYTSFESSYSLGATRKVANVLRDVELPNVHHADALALGNDNVVPVTYPTRKVVTISLTPEKAAGLVVGQAYFFENIPVLSDAYFVLTRNVNVNEDSYEFILVEHSL